MNLEFKHLKVKNIQAPNFLMTPLEMKDFIDFDVKRLYFLSKPTGPSGQHCHLKEKELFVVLQGSCTMVIDKGNGKEELELHGPEDAVYVGNYVWHGFTEFSNDAIVLAVSSTNYNPNREDYIEDYAKYQEALKTL